jgi:hypothetical protein
LKTILISFGTKLKTILISFGTKLKTILILLVPLLDWEHQVGFIEAAHADVVVERLAAYNVVTNLFFINILV